MLERYAQEISEYLSAMMGRSIIITDINGIIIGAPAKERLGDFHPSSVPVVQYKKMSFDDAEAAKKLGVWYPGSTVPLFFQGRVIGTAAIAGEPELVLQFTTLVKNQIESLLREKVYAHSVQTPQHKINELVRDIAAFDPMKDDASLIPMRAERLGINMDIPRGVISIAFSNFRGLDLAKNPVRLSYQSKGDPLSDEMDYSMTNNMVIETLREVFADPQNILASVSRDRFVILWTLLPSETEDISLGIERAKELCAEAAEKLREGSIETIIGIGHPAQNLYELPFAYKNAMEIVTIAEKLSLGPGIYGFDEMLLQHILLSITPSYPIRYMEKKLNLLYSENDAQGLIDTFRVYCESLFSKQKAAEKLHLHRNTLAYRLSKIEERLNISTENFEEVLALYMIIIIRELGKQG
ncbi:helix-turn-helix domain-containing protein, partial [Synergistaceae bacterium OttesenSCG-928-D05]|nr:helix-turn-helix domain-containing protein [Synergistaceae bacterium OttesenSCG-928-D05]